MPGTDIFISQFCSLLSDSMVYKILLWFYELLVKLIFCKAIIDGLVAVPLHQWREKPSELVVGSAVIPEWDQWWFAPAQTFAHYAEEYLKFMKALKLL